MIDYSKLTGWKEFLDTPEYKEILADIRRNRELREAFPLSEQHRQAMKILEQENWEETLNGFGYSC